MIYRYNAEYEIYIDSLLLTHRHGDAGHEEL